MKVLGFFCEEINGTPVVVMNKTGGKNVFENNDRFYRMLLQRH